MGAIGLLKRAYIGNGGVWVYGGCVGCVAMQLNYMHVLIYIYLDIVLKNVCTYANFLYFHWGRVIVNMYAGGQMGKGIKA